MSVCRSAGHRRLSTGRIPPLAYLQEMRQALRKPSTASRRQPGAAGDAIRLENQLCFALYAASRAMTNAYRPILSGLDLTYPQYLVMLALWEQDNVTISALGDRLYLDFGTLTPLAAAGRPHARRAQARPQRRTPRQDHPDPAGQKASKSAADVPRQLRCRIQLSRQQTASLRHDLRLLLEALPA